MLADIVFVNKTFSPLYYTGAVCVLLGFVLVQQAQKPTQVDSGGQPTVRADENEPADSDTRETTRPLLPIIEPESINARLI
ncbi:MAG: hypothetical protein MHM6MM_007975 [Cercozoa sp. M6MM]